MQRKCIDSERTSATAVPEKDFERPPGHGGGAARTSKNRDDVEDGHASLCGNHGRLDTPSSDRCGDRPR